MSRPYRYALSCTAALALACPMAVAAQTAPATQDDDASDDIVVTGRNVTSTATKTEIPLIETPQSISIITRENLEVRNVQRVKDALRFTAGVQVDKFGGDTRYDQIELRGFSATIFGEYRDGLRQVSNGSLFFRNEAYGLEALEVLKGPSSVLFGQNAPGGLVNLVSKRPTATTFAEAQVDIGNFGRRQVKADLSGSLDDGDTVLARLTVLGRDGRSDLPGRSRDDRIYIAPAVTFKPFGSTELTLYTQFLTNESNGQPFFYTDATGNASRVRTYDPNYDQLSQEQLLVGYTVRQSLIGDTLRFQQNARYGEIDLVHLLVGANGVAPAQRIVPRIAFGTRADLQSYAIDNQLSGRLTLGTLELNLLLGYDYTRTDSFTDLEFGAGTAQGVPDLNLDAPAYGQVAIPRPPRIALTDRRDSQGGLYGQVQAKYAGLIVTGGLRRDNVSSRIVNELTGTGTNPEDSATTYRVGLTKVFANGLAPFVSYSTSFQIVPGADFFGRAFTPSTGRQVEGGVKYEPRGLRGLLTASVFQLTQNDVLTIDPDRPGLGFSVQTGQIRARGVELEASLEPVRGLATGAAFTWNDVTVVESNGPDQGKTPPATPRILTSAFANYTIGRFSIGGAVRYVGASFADQLERVRNPAATYADLFGAVTVDRMRFGLNVDNLFDRRNTICNFGFCYFVQGRSILASVRYRY